MAHILLVDDEPEVLIALSRILRKQYELSTANNAHEALDLLNQTHVDLVISDIRMPTMSGIELLKKIRELYPHMGRILLSGYADMEQCQQAISDEVARIILSKPWDNFELKDIIALIVELTELKNENSQLRLQLDEQRNTV